MNEFISFGCEYQFLFYTNKGKKSASEIFGLKQISYHTVHVDNLFLKIQKYSV